MRFVIIFCLFVAIELSQVFADSNDITTGDIVLTEENISAAFKIKVPKWVRSFRREVKDNRYEYHSTQPSLEILRLRKIGNCVAFANLGARYALSAGWRCQLISIASGTDGHMFLYATNGEVNWAVSNKKAKQVGSIKDAMVRMNALSYGIIAVTALDSAGMYSCSDSLINNALSP